MENPTAAEHGDEHLEGAIIDTTRDIMAAVNRQLNGSKEAMIEEVATRTTATLEEAIKRAMKESTSKLAKRQKTDETTKITGKGNKLRYEANKEILEKVQEAVDAIDQNEIAEVRKFLTEGMSLISKQQKLIRIADREEDGWEVVKYYVDDDIASDTDDEKSLKTARKEAAASKKKRVEKKQNERKYKFRNFRGRSYGRYNYGGRYGRQNENLRQTGNSKVCFSCGKEGHFQFSCPSRGYRR